MKVQMLKNLVGVEQKVKTEKKQPGYLHMPESTQSMGIIKYLGKEYSGELRVGMQVYYGDKRTQIRMSGSDVQVMEPDNVVAIVEEQDEKEA